jgi:hypothetical protein
VAANEIIRLRMKARDNKAISTSGHSHSLRAWTSPRPILGFPWDLFWEGPPQQNSRPTEQSPGFQQNMAAKRHVLN